MAKWGARAALAFTLTMLAGLLATTLATTASAETTWQEQSYGLEVEAGFAGSGNDIDVTVTGCPAGSYVRLLVDMYPLGDYMMPDSGPLYVTLELPDWLADALPLKVVKAYCFDTNGVAFADIQDGGTPGGGDNGDTGNDGNTGDNGDTGNNGGTTPPDFKDCELVTGINAYAYTPDANWGAVGLWKDFNPDDVEWFFDVTAGTKLMRTDGQLITKVSLCDPSITPPDKPDLSECVWVYDFSNLNVQGDTFIPDRSYGLVGLFINTNISDATFYENVQAGDVLVSENGNIKKIALCDPGDKPGYTPKGNLAMEANLSQDGTMIDYIVVGCPSGNRVSLEVDRVWQRFVTAGANDTAAGSIPVPAGLPLITFYAQCDPPTLGFGLTGIGGVPTTATPSAAATETNTQVGATYDGSTDKEKLAKLIDVNDQASADKLKAIEAKQSQSLALPALFEGIPDGAIVGAGERSVDNPAGERAVGETSEGTKGASSGFPTTQAGLGVLSAAGLLAFVGLRRVSKSMANPANHAD